MKNEFNIAKYYATGELEAIDSMFKLAAETRSQHFPCFNIRCAKCPFSTLKGQCGGKHSAIVEKYGGHPDWRQIESRWQQEVIDNDPDHPIEISMDKSDAKVLSEYIRRTNETLVIPDEMRRVSEYVKHLIDASLKHGNKDGD